jgi:hypothetical protein
MVVGVTVTVSKHGNIFTKDVKKRVEVVVNEEALDKITDRIMGTGKKFGIKAQVKRNKKTGKQTRGTGLGMLYNELSADRSKALSVRISSTAIPPRVTGSAWTKYNMAIAKSMMPRIIKKQQERLAAELGN